MRDLEFSDLGRSARIPPGGGLALGLLLALAPLLLPLLLAWLLR